MEVLAPGKTAAEVDLVFVHGLRGHPLDTWKKDEIVWPRDLLPDDVPNARILTFGYQADAVSFFNHVSHSSIFQHAQNLLQDLQLKRRTADEKKRPIIFIGHSLGGLVIKDALCKAYEYHMQNRQPRAAAILVSTTGVIFLGTPHRGSSQTAWAKVATRLAKYVLKDQDDRVIDALKRGSEVLERLQDSFAGILHNLTIYSFFEDLAVTGVGKIVDDDSATIGCANEVKRWLSANHMDMCKFDGRESKAYERVSGAILDSVEDALAKPPTPLAIPSGAPSRHLSPASGDTDGSQKPTHSTLLLPAPPLPARDRPDLFIGSRPAPSPQAHLQSNHGKGYQTDDRFVMEARPNPGAAPNSAHAPAPDTLSSDPLSFGAPSARLFSRANQDALLGSSTLSGGLQASHRDASQASSLPFRPRSQASSLPSRPRTVAQQATPSASDESGSMQRMPGGHKAASYPRAFFRSCGEDAQDVRVAEYKDADQWSAARKAEVSVLETRRQQLGDHHPTTLLSVYSMARIELELASLESAKMFAEWAWSSSSKASGREDPFAMRAECLAAEVKLNLGKLSEAEELVNTLMVYQSEIMGLEHFDTMQTLRQQGLICMLLERDVEAQAHFQQRLDILVRVVSETHPLTSEAYVDVADNLIRIKTDLYTPYLVPDTTSQAVTMANAAYDRLKETVGARHQATLRAGDVVSQTMIKQGQYTEALVRLRRSSILSRNAFGAGHPFTQQSALAMATCYLHMQREEEARRLYLEVSANYTRVYGPNHPRTLLVELNLGQSYLNKYDFKDLGRFVAAGQHLQRGLQGLLPILGAGHSCIKAAQQAMEICKPMMDLQQTTARYGLPGFSR